MFICCVWSPFVWFGFIRWAEILHEEAEEMFDFADKDRDGKINYRY